MSAVLHSCRALRGSWSTTGRRPAELKIWLGRQVYRTKRIESVAQASLRSSSRGLQLATVSSVLKAASYSSSADSQVVARQATRCSKERPTRLKLLFRYAVTGPHRSAVRQRRAASQPSPLASESRNGRPHGDGTHEPETSSNVRGPDTHQKEPAPRAGHAARAPDRAPPNIDGDSLRGVVHAHYKRL